MAKAGHTSVGLTSESLANSPLTKVGESSVDNDRAKATASEIATASGTASLKTTYQAPMRRMVRSTAGMRSTVQPWL